MPPKEMQSTSGMLFFRHNDSYIPLGKAFMDLPSVEEQDSEDKGVLRLCKEVSFTATIDIKACKTRKITRFKRKFCKHFAKTFNESVAEVLFPKKKKRGRKRRWRMLKREIEKLGGKRW